jgi:RNA polymerase sigma-70 factor, ECF subfamily
MPNVSKEDFRKIVEEYMDYVYAICRRTLGDAQEARDASQETFFKVYRKWNQYKPEKSLKTWICSIALNTCRDIFRRRKHLVPAGENMEMLLSDRGSDQAETENRLMAGEILASLPFDYRNIMVLFYLEQKTVKEISKILRIPPVLVKVRLFRARKQLLKQFGERV